VRFEIRAFCLKSLGNNILISVFKIMHVGVWPHHWYVLDLSGAQ